MFSSDLLWFWAFILVVALCNFFRLALSKKADFVCVFVCFFVSLFLFLFVSLFLCAFVRLFVFVRVGFFARGL